MNTEMNISPKSPISSPVIDITSLVLTAAVYLATSLSGTPFQKFVHSLLHDRGAIQYVITYFIIRNIMAFIFAITRKQLPPYYSKQLLVLSLFPFFLGLLGAVQGMGTGIGGLVPLLVTGKELVLRDVIGTIALASAMSLDALFLGLLGTILCLGLYVWSLSKINTIVQQAGPAYPPQGVGSADP
jgi:hypothetical protein